MEKKTETKEVISDELKSIAQKGIDEKLEIVANLNKIAYPLSVTVFSHGGPWTIRNIAFWKELQKGDENMLKFMTEFLTESK